MPTDSKQDDNSCPNIEAQEENAHKKYSTCRRGYCLLMEEEICGGMGELEGGEGEVR